MANDGLTWSSSNGGVYRSHHFATHPAGSRGIKNCTPHSKVAVAAKEKNGSSASSCMPPGKQASGFQLTA